MINLRIHNRLRVIFCLFIISLVFLFSFPVQVNAAPAITGVSPSKVSKSGQTELFIKGTGFSWDGGSPTVTFNFGGAGAGTAKVTGKYGDDTLIAVDVPAQPDKCNGTIPYITITNPDNSSKIYNANLTYIDDPDVVNFFPRIEVTVTGYSQSGGYYSLQINPPNPNREIYLEGSNLSDVTTVEAYQMIGAREQLADTIIIGTNNITDGKIHFPYKSSYMDGYQVKFKVKNVAGAIDETTPVDYSRISMPAVTSFDANPQDLVERMNLRIAGTGFVPNTAGDSNDDHLNKVIIDQTSLDDSKVVCNSAGTILDVVIPDVTVAGAGKSFTLRTLQSGGALTKAETIYKSAFTINKRPPDLKLCLPLLPNRGSVNGGDKVLVAIQGYDENTQILIGGNPVASKAVYTQSLPDYYGYPSDAKVLEVVTPASDNKAEGKVDVRVQNARYPKAIYDEAQDAYLYTGEGQFLQVNDISEVSGPASGGQIVTIEGFFARARSDTNSQLYYLEDGRYTNGAITGTPVEIDRDSSGGYSISGLDISGDGLYLKEVYPNYDLEGKKVTLEIYSLVKVYFGSAEAQITDLQNYTNPRKQNLKVVTGPYTLGKNELAKQVEVKVNLFEYMFIQGEGQFVGPPDDLPFTGFDVCDKTYTYRKALTYPEILSINPSSISWKDVGQSRQLVIDGWDLYSGLTIEFESDVGTVSMTDNGSNMTIQGSGEQDSRGRFRKTLTIPDPPDFPVFNNGVTQLKVRITNWDKQQSNRFTLTLTSAPAIDKITPSMGPDTGNCRVLLTGSDFYYNPRVILNVPGVAEQVEGTDIVVLDANMAKITNASNTPGVFLTFTTPSVQGGSWTLPDNFDVTVTNQDGGSFTASEGYTYMVEPADTSQPRITGINPKQGLLAGGQDVTISGNNFNANAIVTIDGFELTNKVIKPQVITGKTPKGNRTNVMVPVQVVNPDGGMDSRDIFMYYEQTSNPKITSIIPDKGTTGIKVIIKGSDFSTRVEVEGEVLQSATVTMVHDSCGEYAFEMVNEPISAGVASTDIGKARVIDSSTIELIVPEFLADGTPRAGNCTVIVRNRDNVTATSTQLFKYMVPLSQPAITSINPTFGSIKGGNLITIKGTGFLEEEFTVFFGGNAAKIVKPMTETIADGVVYYELQVEAPAASQSGPVDVTVVNYDGGYATVADGYTYTEINYLPIIKSITPTSGPSTGGQVVTIKGRQFQPATEKDGILYPTVTFGGVPAIVDPANFRLNSETIVVTTPPYQGAGKVDVIVTNPDGGSAKGIYTYVQTKLTITSITPDNLANMKIPCQKTITGTNFLPPMIYQGETLRTKIYLQYPAGSKTPDVLVELTEGTTAIPQSDGSTVAAANIDIVSATEMHLVIPALDMPERVGKWTLILQNPDGATASTEIIFSSVSPDDLPQVNLPLEPNEGLIRGGTKVTITGKNFNEGVKITFGGKPATLVSRNEEGTEMVVTTPAGNDPADIDKAVDVIITNTDGGQCILAGAFTYRKPPNEPIIISIVPASGPTRGGTKVTITGKNFQSGIKLYFNEDQISSIKVTSTTIVFTTPRHAPGSVDVLLRNPDLGEALKTKGFTYNGPPEVEEGKFIAEIVGGSAIRLSWTGVDGVKRYEITMSRDNSKWQFLTGTTKTEYFIMNPKPASYYFRLRTVNETGASPVVDATPFPLSVSAGSLSNVPVTPTINDSQDVITVNQGTLQVILGKNLPGSGQYTVNLTEEQKKAVRADLFIPTAMVDQGSQTVIVLENNYLRLDVPANAFNTLEYQQSKTDETDAYIKLSIFPLSAQELEVASLNTDKQVFGGFTLIASYKAPRTEKLLSMFNSNVWGYYSKGQSARLTQAFHRDRVTGRWVPMPGMLTANGLFGVGLLQPDMVYFIDNTK
ncbi:MAG: IPT/TIG domain-containing protein [Chitinophagales bacterium]